jgi:hypothetical protein
MSLLKIPETVNCFCCDKELENMDYQSDDGSYVYDHPEGGMVFTSYEYNGAGLLGSTERGCSLNIVICDECFMENKDNIRDPDDMDDEKEFKLNINRNKLN